MNVHVWSMKSRSMEFRSVRSRGVLRLILLLLAVTALSACERVRFTNAPADASGCDRQLVGQWLSEETEDGPRGEIEATIEADCSLQITENEKKPPRVSDITRLRSARVADIDVLWIDAAWADRAFDLEADAITPAADANEHDVYLYAWRPDGDRLMLTAPNDKALAHAIIDDTSKGDVLRRQYELHVRVDASQAELQSLLARGTVFKGGRELRFVRRSSQP